MNHKQSHVEGLNLVDGLLVTLISVDTVSLVVHQDKQLGESLDTKCNFCWKFRFDENDLQDTDSWLNDEG